MPTQKSDKVQPLTITGVPAAESELAKQSAARKAALAAKRDLVWQPAYTKPMSTPSGLLIAVLQAGDPKTFQTGAVKDGLTPPQCREPPREVLAHHLEWGFDIPKDDVLPVEEYITGILESCFSIDLLMCWQWERKYDCTTST